MLKECPKESPNYSLNPMRKLKFVAIAICLLHLGATHLYAQTDPVTREEMLRGSVTPERDWWDVLH